MRRAFLIDEWRVDTILDQGRLVLNCFVNNGVEFVIGHDFQEIGH